ncbi:SigE family RNA polymerase sigma factor [Cellulosimicrobium protaetiae]|uniref:SigE family RNA polymerase sigma factor n=2 Tax=Cellulosimicrobium protaetiae TaxID=2587808 RepID=A0A6M5UM26_9MICO|nr:SigE family RNA polymerase sigma factor [Cellulosimicrobium protaetiae]
MTTDDPPSPGGWAERDLHVVTDAGHAEEFVAFVETAKDPLHRLAYLLSGNHHRAEELVQQTFERTWRSWRRARRGDPLAYARTILANLRVDTWRRTRHEVLTGIDHDGRRHAPDATGRVHDRDAVVRALLTLPLRQRRVVVLRHLLDLSEAEVSHELGIPVGTVKSTASRALARLRTTLADAPDPAGTDARTGSSPSSTEGDRS